MSWWVPVVCTILLCLSLSDVAKAIKSVAAAIRERRSDEDRHR
jgi:hypothetical protein